MSNYDSYGLSIQVIIQVVLVVLVILFSIFIIASYILEGISLYSMAKNRDKAKSDKAFWAWIPIGKFYLMGLLARSTSYYYGTSIYKNMHTLLPACCVVNLFFTILIRITPHSELGSLLLILVQLAYIVAFYICLHGLLKGYDYSKKAGMHVALSIFVPLYSSILLFVFRNRRCIYDTPSSNSDANPSL